MNILHAFVTHLSPDHVRRQVSYLEKVTPNVPRLLVYGGSRDHFEALRDLDPIHLTDDSLRGPPNDHCFNELLIKTSAFLLKNQATFDFIHVTEYDHLILSREYFGELSRILEKAACDFLGKNCNDRTNSDWYHLHRCRENMNFISFLRQISTRKEKTNIYGSLFDGHTISTAALKAIMRIPALPRAYSEALFPSVIHHMGLKVRDIGTHSNFFQEVRYRPAHTKAEVIAMIKRKVHCCHPFKELDAFDEIERVVLSGQC